MDKKNYITDGYRQLNNSNHYEKVNGPIYPRTAIKITAVLNKLKCTCENSEDQLQFLKHPQESRPQYYYVPPKIY